MVRYIKYRIEYLKWEAEHKRLLFWVTQSGGPISPYFEALIEHLYSVPSYYDQ